MPRVHEDCSTSDIKYLKWGTGYQKPITTIEQPHNLRQCRVFILDAMGFVNHDILPRNFLKC